MRGRPNNRVPRFFRQSDINRLYMLLNKTLDFSPQHRLHIILMCQDVFQTAVFDELLLFPRHFCGPFWKSLVILGVAHHNRCVINVPCFQSVQQHPHLGHKSICIKHSMVIHGLFATFKNVKGIQHRMSFGRF